MPTSRNVQVIFATATDGFDTVCCEICVVLDGLDDMIGQPRRRALHSTYRAKTRRRNRRR